MSVVSGISIKRNLQTRRKRELNRKLVRDRHIHVCMTCKAEYIAQKTVSGCRVAKTGIDKSKVSFLPSQERAEKQIEIERT